MGEHGIDRQWVQAQNAIEDNFIVLTRLEMIGLLRVPVSGSGAAEISIGSAGGQTRLGCACAADASLLTWKHCESSQNLAKVEVA